MKKSNYRTNRNHRDSRNTSTGIEQRHYNTKVNKNQVAKDTDTGPIVFDMPEIEAQELGGRALNQ
jgi:hypothetical protein